MYTWNFWMTSFIPHSISLQQRAAEKIDLGMAFFFFGFDFSWSSPSSQSSPQFPSAKVRRRTMNKKVFIKKKEEGEGGLNKMRNLFRCSWRRRRRRLTCGTVLKREENERHPLSPCVYISSSVARSKVDKRRPVPSLLQDPLGSTLLSPISRASLKRTRSKKKKTLMSYLHRCLQLRSLPTHFIFIFLFFSPYFSSHAERDARS